MAEESTSDVQAQREIPLVIRVAADETKPDGSRDPLQLMTQIAENENLTEARKDELIRFSGQRFKNRRRMAYLCLLTIIASAALLFIGAFIDGLLPCVKQGTCNGVLNTIKENNALFIWVNGFLAAIVGAYYGVSAWRPSS